MKPPVQSPPTDLFSEPTLPESLSGPATPEPGRDLPLMEEVPDVPDEPAKEYAPPPAGIFKTSPAMGPLDERRKQEYEATAAGLEKIFDDFSIKGKVVAIQPGPVVTVYEYQASAGTRLSRINALIDDIALALKVDSVFIHPVSGKNAVGVQVPNQDREVVLFGDLVGSPEFRNATSPLTFVLGKNLRGEAVCEDLASMPHLLTAGQTGSGKSVAINALLCSIIMKAPPERVRMILVDPKVLELKIYEGIPHLLMPVITEPTRAGLALKWACHEMDRRYRLMEQARVRNIGAFNDFWHRASPAERDALDGGPEQKPGPLPQIVLVIDELADLMLTAPKDVEASIQRLAQKARASGIHLVLATQRPSVDVITGVIKANLPSRIAFKVFSRGDSRTILDSMGADKLLGKGDMLCLKPGASRLERVQGAFLSDQEVVDLVEAVRLDQSGGSWDEEAIAWIEEEAGRGKDDAPAGATGEDDDPRWDEALTIAQRNGAISASFLQRQLKIGYNRAARMVESMENQGLVSGADGSKPRKWLGPQDLQGGL